MLSRNSISLLLSTIKGWLTLILPDIAAGYAATSYTLSYFYAHTKLLFLYNREFWLSSNQVCIFPSATSVLLHWVHMRALPCLATHPSDTDTDYPSLPLSSRLLAEGFHNWTSTA